LLVQTSPDDIPFPQLEKLVPAELRSDPEIAIALARRAQSCLCFDSAESYAREAYQTDRDSPATAEILATVLIDSQQRAVIPLAEFRAYVPQPDKLEEAEALLTDVLQKYGSKLPDRMITRLRNARSVCRALLGHHEAAAQDADAAHELDQHDPQSILQRARHLFRQEDFDTAVSLLEDLCQRDDIPRPHLLLAQTLIYRNQPGDQDAAVHTLKSNILDHRDDAPELRLDYAAILIHALGQLGHHEEALSQIDTFPTNFISASATASLRALALSQAGQTVRAREAAQVALRSLPPTPASSEVRLLASTLGRLDLHDEALRLWKSIVHPRYVGFDTLQLLDTAHRCEDDDFILNFCEDLRQNDIFDTRCLELETYVLEQYSCFDAVLELAAAYLSICPDTEFARHLRVRQSCIALALDKPDLVCADPALLPAADKAAPEVGEAVVHVLSQGGRALEAIEYGYELLRRHFDKAECHRAFFRALKPGDLDAPRKEVPDHVAPGCAVYYQELPGGERDWFIIEDGDDPQHTR
ncbi:unnamed protein product, partial [marine sediment metagenome]